MGITTIPDIIYIEKKSNLPARVWRALLGPAVLSAPLAMTLWSFGASQALLVFCSSATAAWQTIHHT